MLAIPGFAPATGPVRRERSPVATGIVSVRLPALAAARLAPACAPPVELPTRCGAGQSLLPAARRLPDASSLRPTFPSAAGPAAPPRLSTTPTALCVLPA